MTEKPPEFIASELIRWQMRLFRGQASTVRDVESLLFGQELRGELVAVLSRGDPTEPVRFGDRMNRADVVEREAGKVIRATTRRVNRRVERDAIHTALVDQKALVRIMGRVDVPVSPLAPSRITRIVERQILNGAASRSWWRGQAEAIKTDYGRRIRAGIQQGDALGGLVTRVRGSRANAYTDGVMNFRRRRDAEALVRTSIQQATNGVRQASWRDNADVVRGWQWLTAFDSRVCRKCGAMSGGAWDHKGNPLPGSKVMGKPLLGGPPAHIACRCTSVPVFVGEDLVEDIDFGEWLEKQNAQTQVKVLGVRRREMWREGKIDLTDLVDQRGRELGIDQLLEEVA